MKEIQLCVCGCGREVINKHRSGCQRVYFSSSCYKRKKPLPPITKICVCGCGREFTDATRAKQRKYYDRTECKAELGKIVRAENARMAGLKKRMPTSRIGSKKFRGTICKRPGVLSLENGVECRNYSRCSDSLMTNGLWEYEKNGGVDCWEDPGKFVPVKGSSFGVCSVNR